MFGKKFSSNIRRKKRMIISSIILLVVFLGLGYSAFTTNLGINGTLKVDKYDPTPYGVLEKAADGSVYAKEYTGTINDSPDPSAGTEEIFYWNAPNTTQGNILANEIKDKWNILFAGFCWQMLRTTSTGGTKMIYNGVPNNGTCHNSGIDQSIGQAKYNNNESSLADVGYMYNTRYAHNQHGYSSLSTRNDVVSSTYANSSSSYVYGTGVTYDTSTSKYTLTGTSQATWANTYASSGGLYTCKTNNTTPCSTVYYILGGLSGSMHVFEMTGGNLMNYYNTTFVLGTGYTESNGTYTLKNTVTISKIDWYNSNGAYANYYTCGDNRTSCTDLRKIYRAENAYYYYLSNVIYAKSYTYNSATNTYKLDTNNRMKTFDYIQDIDDISNNHYTCFSTTDTCTELKYAYFYSIMNNYLSYIILTDGKSVEDAMDEMLYADNVNATNSTIKTAIDNWYAANMTQYTNKLEDTVFCNDRTITELNGWNPNGGNIKSALHFKNNNATGDISCNNETDRFSTSNNKAKLIYPVGLPSSEEMNLLENNLLRYIGNNYWLSSPASFERAYYVILVNYSNGNILFEGANSYTTAYVRPVVSLKPGIEYVSGNGSMDNPYVVE